MKANGVPEKIYYTGNGVYDERVRDTDIEYTRTDAFIEKACAILEGISSQYVVEQFKSRII